MTIVIICKNCAKAYGGGHKKCFISKEVTEEIEELNIFDIEEPQFGVEITTLKSKCPFCDYINENKKRRVI